MSLLEDFDADDFVRRVLAEDLGRGGDVTSNATIAEDARFSAAMNARQKIVVAGSTSWFIQTFNAGVPVAALSTSTPLVLVTVAVKFALGAFMSLMASAPFR